MSVLDVLLEQLDLEQIETNLFRGVSMPMGGPRVFGGQVIGQALPLTHYLRIVRGILLKGNGFEQIMPNLWPIALFLLISLTIGLGRYRRTLD